MSALAREQSSNCANPILDLFTTVNGILVDVAVLEFEIYDKTGVTPLKVYPPVGRQAVNVSQLCPTGDKLSTGRFVANWTVPITEALGTHEIRWAFRLTPSSPELTYKEEFEVLANVVGNSEDGYCTVQELRDEGVTIAQISDSDLQVKIALASRYIDSFTGQFFVPRTIDTLYDGRGGSALHLNIPIISISEVHLLGVFDTSDSTLLDPSSYRVYNRHIGGLLSPDDRNNPKIELFRSTSGRRRLINSLKNNSFPFGTQNVRVVGVFGYTDPNGSPTGKTPDLINHACKLLTIKSLYSLTDPARQNAVVAGRLIEEKTRDQSYKLADTSGTSSSTSWLTGDPEIDTILARYMRLPGIKFV